MKLSMWMIYDALIEQIPVEAFIKDGRCDITDVRGFVPGMSQEEHYVYVGNSKDWDLDIPPCTVIYHKKDYLTTSESPIIVLNLLMDIIQQANRLNNRLSQAVLSDSSFQEIACIVAETLRNPVVIIDNFFQVLGIAGDMPGESWKYMLDHRVSPPTFIKQYIHEKHFTDFMTSHTPSVRVLPDYALWKTSLRINCFFDRIALCRICISFSDSEISQGIIQFAQYVGKMIEQIPTSQISQIILENASDAIALLEDRDVSASNKVYQHIRYLFKDTPFYVCRFGMSEPTDNKTIYYWFCGQLEASLPNTYAFPYQDYILMLIPTEKEIQKKMAAILPQLLEQTGFYCAVSNPCYHIEQLREYFAQTLHVPRFAAARYKQVYFFEDCNADILIHKITEEHSLLSWIHKGVFALEDYDKIHGTEYLHTLSCLADNQFVSTRTADALFIHRNSLQYRINKIEKIMECNLADPSTHFYITLSCRIHALSRRSSD